MTTPVLPMTLGSGYTEGGVPSGAYRLLVGGMPIALSDLSFERVHPIAAGSGFVCDLAYDSTGQVIYFREAGLRSLRLRDGTFDSIADRGSLRALGDRRVTARRPASLRRFLDPGAVVDFLFGEVVTVDFDRRAHSPKRLRHITRSKGAVDEERGSRKISGSRHRHGVPTGSRSRSSRLSGHIRRRGARSSRPHGIAR